MKNRLYKIPAIIGMVIIFLGAKSILSASPESESKGATMVEYKQYLVKLIGTRQGWPENMTENEARIMGEHFVYLQDLIAKKKVLLAGPCFDPVFGLIILQTVSEEEAIEIMKSEPSVVQGVHTYEISPMTASLMAHYTPPNRYVTYPSDKAISKEITVKASLEEVWKTWTTTEGVKTFFSPEAKIELRPGGAYEIYFLLDAPYGSKGGEDCKVLSYLPKEMLSFEWNAPPSFGELRFIKTQVIMQFEPTGADSVKITLNHIGWGKTNEWENVYEYFDKAWSYVLSNCQKRFEKGPLDFNK
ncbi:MAG: SRPBCC domain-containing protein [bacterium]